MIVPPFPAASLRKPSPCAPLEPALARWGVGVIQVTRFSGVRSHARRDAVSTLATMDQRFRLVSMLGQGGNAVVYDAIDRRLGRRVALKFLAGHPEPREAQLALSQEAAALKRVANPGVCAGYGVDEYDGLPCLVMERLRGRDLKQLLADRSLTIAEILRLAMHTAQGLHAIHWAGLVHNDIKPANLFVTATGVRIVDFGLATPFPAEAPPAKDRPWKDSVFGTADYIAPERIVRRPVTPLSDLFSFGVVLYEMITGVKPFTGASRAETVFNVLDLRPASVTGLRPDCPPALARIVAKLLAKRPEDRFASTSEVCHALLRVSALTRPRYERVGSTLVGRRGDTSSTTTHLRARPRSRPSSVPRVGAAA